jgi:hypothetical protein
MKQYRKKPVVIDAIQWDGTEDLALEIAAIGGFEGMLDYKTGAFGGLYIETLEGRMQVSPNDYVIKGVKGEFYPCKPDIFEMTYDKVEESTFKTRLIAVAMGLLLSVTSFFLLLLELILIIYRKSKKNYCQSN